MENKDVYYSDYLQLDALLNAQIPESRLNGREAHDEMLFIIVHQTYELWFKQIRHELDSIIKIMGQPEIHDNSPNLQTVLHRIDRINKILGVAVKQIDVMETMTPLDFLDFRNLLRPASGFQSHQFKLVEATLGLKFEHRFGKSYYISQLREKYIEEIRETEAKKSLFELTDEWLSRMPYFNPNEYWGDYKVLFPEIKKYEHVFWNDYRELYDRSLLPEEKANLELFDNILFKEGENNERKLSAKAGRAALFITLYRGYPLLQLPFQILNSLLEIDELLSTWRYRHVNMVQRTIGTRIGTGGSTGSNYLKSALDKHYIFKELADLTTFLIERENIPKLGKNLERKLGFEMHD